MNAENDRWWIIPVPTPDALYPAEFEAAKSPRHSEMALFEQVGADLFTWENQPGRTYSGEQVLEQLASWDITYHNCMEDEFNDRGEEPRRERVS